MAKPPARFRQRVALLEGGGGGLKVDQVKRLKALEAENTRLRRAVSDLTLEKLILKEAAAGNF
jgi:cell division protein FtsB